MKMKTKNIILIMLVLLLIAAPLVLKGKAEFSGADGQAEKVITRLHPGYRPWATSPWKPPSGEVESLLFALQAAAGAGFIGYYLGYQKARREQGEAPRHRDGRSTH